MTFKEIMPIVAGSNQTVAQATCEALNRIRKEDAECTGYSDSLFMYRIPDHDITEEELFDHILFDKMQYGVPGRFDVIKSFHGLLQSWYTIKPELD